MEEYKDKEEYNNLLNHIEELKQIFESLEYNNWQAKG
jgi:hypothetical protein